MHITENMRSDGLQKETQIMPFPKGKKSYSAKQKKLARVAPPRDKITAADLKAVKRGGTKRQKAVRKSKGGGKA